MPVEAALAQMVDNLGKLSCCPTVPGGAPMCFDTSQEYLYQVSSRVGVVLPLFSLYLLWSLPLLALRSFSHYAVIMHVCLEGLNDWLVQ